MRSLNTCFVLLTLLFATSAYSLEIGSWRLDGGISAGHNSTAGTYYSLGVDFYTFIDDNLAAGVGGYYAAGEHPGRDREYGVGPFVSYTLPIVEFFALSARESIDYIDSRLPIADYSTDPTTWSYKSNYGVASITSFAAHLFVAKFGLTAGYRFALSLNNSDLTKGRSGPFFGLSFSF